MTALPFTSLLAHYFLLTPFESKEKEMEKFCLGQAVPYLKRIDTSFPLASVFGMLPPAANPEERWMSDSLEQCSFTHFPRALSRSVSPALQHLLRSSDSSTR